jgi:hypothetical protein
MDTLMRMLKINDIQISRFKLRSKEEIHHMQLFLYTS